MQHPVRVFARARPNATAPLGVDLQPVAVRSFARRGPLALAHAARPWIWNARGVLCTTWTVARWVSRLAPVHVVGHGSDLVRPRDPRGLRRVWRRCAHPWVVSGHLARVAANRGLHARVLPLPVPEAERRPLGSRWVFVGRALHGKGGDRFVRWVAEAGVKADVVGDGPALPVWKALAEDLEADVRFHGALDRAGVDAVYRRAGAVFLPSRASLAEGLGLTLLEARARGIPVVGTRSGGIPEALGSEGLLVDPEVRGDALRTRVHGLLRPAPPGGRNAFLQALGVVG